MGYNRRRALIIRKAAGGFMVFKNKFLNIAVCDDDKILCSEIETMLNQIAEQLNIHVDISVWFSGRNAAGLFKQRKPGRCTVLRY